MAETPILDAIVEREPIIPRGPIREKIVTKDILLNAVGTIVGETAKHFIREALPKIIRGVR